jgi:thioester reductase-like protein
MNATEEARLRNVVREARTQLAGERARRLEPVAITGMACRFPGADSIESFWDLLHRGTDATREIPADRWNVDRYFSADPAAPGTMYVRRGGFLADVAGFDAAFFGIAPAEALRMDPQQRLLLETTWHALEDAGIDPRGLEGTPAGLFVGLCFDDYGRRTVTSGHPDLIDPYSALGNTRSLAAGRVGYTLGLRGPALTLDTSCSSSLVALHLAVQSLRARECNLAIVAGVNVICAPETMIAFCRMRALSTDGRCRGFSANAAGYGRGEGCGVLVLQRTSDAQADGRTRAVIRGSAVNHDGRSNGLTAPNGLAQEDVLRSALTAAGVEPASVAYVEAHGTGTALGDPIEALALARAYRTASRGPEAAPLRIGSVKSNIGHLESAAGVAGVIKTVLALEHACLPPTLHAMPPNPRIDFATLQMRACDTAVVWPDGDGARRAGVSAFGMSGTNAHVILEEASAGTAHPRRSRGARTTFTHERFWLDWPGTMVASAAAVPALAPVAGDGDGLGDATAALLESLALVAGPGRWSDSLERPLRECGVDSLMVVEIETALLRRGVSASISPGDTPRAIARRIAFGSAAETPPDPVAESALPADIVPQAAPPPALPAEVLLTGATGFLGAFLLYELLHRTPARIHCLVRATGADAALARVAANLARYGLWFPDLASRINALPGRLEAPELGLGTRTYDDLCARIDTVISNGAEVSYVASFAEMRPSHVNGAITLLRLACTGAPKRVHHVSSIAVWESRRYAGKTLGEHESPVEHEGIVLPYSLCKWITDALMREAGRRGLAVTTHRPSLISGHSVTGAWNEGDLLRRFFLSVTRSRLFPIDVGLAVDCSPVDYVSSAIVALALTGLTGATHLQHPRPVPWDTFSGLLERETGSLTRLPYEDWVHHVAGRPEDPLYPLLPFFRRRWGPSRETYLARIAAGRRAVVAADATATALADVGIICPPLDEALVSRYVTAQTA